MENTSVGFYILYYIYKYLLLDAISERSEECLPGAGFPS